MPRYALEFFVQGRGWVRQEEIGYRGTLSSRGDAEDFAAHIIDKMMRASSHPYGSRLGDIVGFRVIEGEGDLMELSGEAAAFKFDEVKHRFYRRGDAYMLYKYWSWPD
jgi:hypothetical protein